MTEIILSLASRRWSEAFVSKLPVDSYELRVHETPYNLEKIIGDLQEASILLKGPGEPTISRSLLEKARSLKLIQSYSVGYESIDVKAATDIGIVVANNMGFNAISVAEHTVMAMLVVAKKAFPGSTSLQQGKWLSNWNTIELYGKTVGILGLGNIGSLVARLLKPFGARVLYNKRSRLTAEQEAELGVEYRGFDQLLAESDIISIHTPLTDETRSLFSEDTIMRMKDGAILVNTARRDIVDEGALADALRSGKLYGAAIDVPRSAAEGCLVCETFRGADNVLLTPHMGSAPREMVPRMSAQVAENLRRFCCGEKILYVVNEL